MEMPAKELNSTDSKKKLKGRQNKNQLDELRSTVCNDPDPPSSGVAPENFDQNWLSAELLYEEAEQQQIASCSTTSSTQRQIGQAADAFFQHQFQYYQQWPDKAEQQQQSSSGCSTSTLTQNRIGQFYAAEDLPRYNQPWFDEAGQHQSGSCSTSTATQHQIDQPAEAFFQHQPHYYYQQEQPQQMAVSTISAAYLPGNYKNFINYDEQPFERDQSYEIDAEFVVEDKSAKSKGPRNYKHRFQQLHEEKKKEHTNNSLAKVESIYAKKRKLNVASSIENSAAILPMAASSSSASRPISTMPITIPGTIIVTNADHLMPDVVHKMGAITLACKESDYKLNEEKRAHNRKCSPCREGSKKVLQLYRKKEEEAAAKLLTRDLVNFFMFLCSTNIEHLDYLLERLCAFTLHSDGKFYERICKCGFAPNDANKLNPDESVHCFSNLFIQMYLIPPIDRGDAGPQNVCTAGRVTNFGFLKDFVFERYLKICKPPLDGPSIVCDAWGYRHPCKITCECGYFREYSGHPDGLIHIFCNFLVLNGLIDAEEAKAKYNSCCEKGRIRCFEQLLDELRNNKCFTEIPKKEADASKVPCLIYSEVGGQKCVYIGFTDGRLVHGTFTFGGRGILHCFKVNFPPNNQKGGN